MRLDGNNGAELGYKPNSQDVLEGQPDFSEPLLALENHRVDEDFLSQSDLTAAI